jgi:hypothetical protein
MSQFVDRGEKAFAVGGAIAQYLRVKLSAGVLAIAGVGDKDLGVIRDDAFAAGETHDVLLRTKPGTVLMVAAKAFAQGAALWTAANGQVSDVDATGALSCGTALQAATEAGDFVEVLR